MPNAILRAGPWGSLTATHEDVPSDTSVESIIYPVNCAKTDWASGQAWAAFYRKPFDYTDVTYGVADLGETISGETDSGGVDMTFCWQSTEEFTIDLNWNMFEPGASNIFPILTWIYDIIDGSGDSFFNTPSDSGTETVTLPATTFGKFSWSVGGYGPNIFTIEASIS